MDREDADEYPLTKPLNISAEGQIKLSTLKSPHKILTLRDKIMILQMNHNQEVEVTIYTESFQTVVAKHQLDNDICFDTIKAGLINDKEIYLVAQTTNSISLSILSQQPNPLTVPFDNKNKILTISDAYSLNNQKHHWVLVTNFGKMYMLWYTNIDKTISIFDITGTNKYFQMFSSVLKPFRPPKFAYSQGSVFLSSILKEEEIIDVVTVLDFSISSKRYDFSAINKTLAPKHLKGVWQMDLAKKLDQQVRSIISIHTITDKSNRLIFFVVAQRSDGKVSIYKIFQNEDYSKSQHNCLESVFQDGLLYRKQSDQLQVMLHHHHLFFMLNKQEIEYSHQYGTKVYIFSIVSVDDLSKQAQSHLSDFRQPMELATYLLHNQQIPCLYGETSIFKLFTSAEKAKQEKQLSNKSISEEIKRMEERSMRSHSSKMYEVVDVEEKISRCIEGQKYSRLIEILFEKESKDLNNFIQNLEKVLIDNREKETQLEEYFLLTVICNSLKDVAQNQNFIDYCLKQWHKQYKSAQNLSSALESLFFKKDKQTVISLLTYLRKNEQTKEINELRNFFNKDMPQKMRNLSNQIKKSGQQNEQLMEKLRQVVDEVLRQNLEEYILSMINLYKKERKQSSENNLKELLQRYLQVMNLLQRMDGLNETIIILYIQNFPESVKNKALHYESTHLFKYLWYKQVVSKYDLDDFFKKKMLKKQSQDQMQMLIQSILERQIQKIKESQQGQNIPFSLRILTWIPQYHQYQQFVLAYLTEKEPKIAVLYAITINSRKEAAQLLKSDPSLILLFKSPSLIYQILTCLRIHIKDEKILCENAILAQFQVKFGMKKFKSKQQLKSITQQNSFKLTIKKQQWDMFKQKFKPYASQSDFNSIGKILGKIE